MKHLLQLLVLAALLLSLIVPGNLRVAYASGGFAWLDDRFSQELAINPSGGISSIAFFKDGDYLVANPHDGRIFRIDPLGHRSLNQVTALGSFHAWVWGLAWGSDGRLYATLPAFGLLRELDSETGGLVREVVTNLASPTALAVDPVNGDLIVVEHGQKRITRVDPETGSTSIFSANPLLANPAGIVFSEDGSVLFVANGGSRDGVAGNNVLAIDRAGNARVLASFTGPALGLALGAPGTVLEHSLLVNRSDGIVDKVDLMTKAVSTFASGGQGGGLAAVDADGHLYFIRGDGIIKVTPGYGHPSPGMNQVVRTPTITTDTTWSSAQSPLTIAEDVVVAPGVTLTVEPGTIIRFAKRASLEVFGTLQVLGTETEPVRFTSASSTPTAGDWGSIRIHPGAAPVRIERAIIEYGGSTQRSADGSLVLGRGTIAALSHLVIQYNDASGLTLYNANATLNDSTIRFNRSGVVRTVYDPFVSSGGGVRSLDSTLTVQRSSISDNVAANLPGDPTSGGHAQAGGLAVQGGAVTILNSTIENNTATYGGGGIGAIGGALIVKNSFIRRNSLSCTGAGTWFCYGGGISMNSTQGEVTGTVIEANAAPGASGGGISAGGGSRPRIVISGNRIAGNTAALGSGATFGSEQTFEHNLVIENESTQSGLLAAAVVVGGDVGSAPTRCNTVAFNRAPLSTDPAGISALTVRPIQENAIYGNTGYQLAPLVPPSYVPSVDLDATNNWWGTRDLSEVAARVLDHGDDGTLPKVRFEPFATMPPSCAPSLDTQPPVMTNLTLTSNPVQVGSVAALSAMVDDVPTGGSHIDIVEFFIGEDPGIGQATSMKAVDGSFDSPMEVATSTIDTSLLGTGVFRLGVRAMDRAGNWTQAESVYLVTFDPSAGYATGGGWIIPGSTTSDPGDLLPGLDGTSKANFGFVVKYQNGTSTVPGGNLQFHYSVGKFHLHSASMEWLIVTNTNWAKFQGLASIDDTSNLYPFRVDARDGDANGGRQPDRFVIRIYTPGADPDTAEPVYKASGDVVGGQIKIHR